MIPREMVFWIDGIGVVFVTSSAMGVMVSVFFLAGVIRLRLRYIFAQHYEVS